MPGGTSLSFLRSSSRPTWRTWGIASLRQTTVAADGQKPPGTYSACRSWIRPGFKCTTFVLVSMNAVWDILVNSGCGFYKKYLYTSTPKPHLSEVRGADHDSSSHLIILKVPMSGWMLKAWICQIDKHLSYNKVGGARSRTPSEFLVYFSNSISPPSIQDWNYHCRLFMCWPFGHPCHQSYSHNQFSLTANFPMVIESKFKGFHLAHHPYCVSCDVIYAIFYQFIQFWYATSLKWMIRNKI
jgi:hypothetical protein